LCFSDLAVVEIPGISHLLRLLETQMNRKLDSLTTAFAIAAVLATQMASGQTPATRQSFLDTWTNRPVVLKKPLYGIAYDSPSGQAITAVSPDRGTFFQIQLISSGDQGFKISAPIVDREPQRLLDKVAARLGARFSPKLLTFKVGTRMKARARFEDLNDWGDERTRLIIDLYDDLDTANVATQIHVQWPEPFSDDFSERSKVEGLIAEFLKPPTQVK
jgi:hypothetical protein